MAILTFRSIFTIYLFFNSVGFLICLTETVNRNNTIASLPELKVLKLITDLVLSVRLSQSLSYTVKATFWVNSCKYNGAFCLCNSTYIGVTFNAKSSNCLQVQCRFTCFNGRQSQIVSDIENAIIKTNNTEVCETIEELRLYSYDFPDATLPVGFLSTYGHKVKNLYIGISNISKIEDGAFGNGIFQRITLEDLQLKEIGKGFFTNISNYFKSLLIKQEATKLSCIYPDFMDYVKYQIEYLALQLGIECLRNVTSSDSVLAILSYADFSHNNFSDHLHEDCFSKLTMIESLVLSHSHIEYLPDYIFQGMEYLKFLDISHNNLMTISKNIFGYRDISRDLRIFANDNLWHCDCQLVVEMNIIFAYHSGLVMQCETPDEYKDWSVFDTRICDGGDESVTGYPTVDPTTQIKTTTLATTDMSTTTISSWIPTLPTSATPSPDDVISLECSTSSKTLSFGSSRFNQNIYWPHVEFHPKTFGQLTVKVTVKSYDDDTEITYGLFWFSKTTKEYYMMEMMPSEYGLGCYFTMPLQTIVTGLVPNVAYTFCLVNSEQASVSPFNCKSVHVGGNLDTYYNSWLSKKVSSKGISIMVLGVVFFTFFGMIIVFLILKQKPIWLRGSKRVLKPKCSSGQIIVLPRGNTAAQLKQKENIISNTKMNRPFSCVSRQNSMESLASSGSYMNANLYEVIPAYMTFEEFSHPISTMGSNFEIYDTCIWKPKLAEHTDVRYAQIPPRTKRISSDPLPAIPTEVSDGPLSVRGLEGMENTNNKVNELITLL